MQQVKELTQSIDSLETKFKGEQRVYGQNFVTTSIANDINYKEPKEIEMISDSIFALYNNPLKIVGDSLFNRHSQVVRAAKNTIKSLQRNLESKKRNFFINQKRINLHKNSLHEKYTLGFSVFFLFLVGASLGAIIRKGGLGLPMVLAILIFLTYHYIGLFGKNAAEDSSISPFVGSWLSLFIIAPFAIYLTRRASADKGLIDYDFLIVSLENLFSSIKNTIFVRIKSLWKKRH